MGSVNDQPPGKVAHTHVAGHVEHHLDRCDHPFKTLEGRPDTVILYGLWYKAVPDGFQNVRGKA